ncbi:hypothetical protein [Brasilonema sp. UFV-L1]|uniref:hypothetical protein n=1 Tax=Brasilonema sp. UFV-L1 TaxID=2234130 RepID=UPI00145E5453|nr:hypothetical protein [Brasilonema sp. UFV-L1]NMG10773.1 hypothetical protein [Brasilonema sp. UFV-L1]
MKQAVRKNFEEKVSYIAKSVPNMVVTDWGSFLSVDCSLPSDTFNVIVVRYLSTTHQLLNEGVGYFTSKGFPVAIWYWEDDIDKFGIDALISHGLVHSETHISMYADLADSSNFEVVSPEGLLIKYAENASEI